MLSPGDPAGGVTAYTAAVKALPPSASREKLLLQHRLGVLYYGLGDFLQVTLTLTLTLIGLSPGQAQPRQNRTQRASCILHTLLN